jgi:benzoyl-CoA reductase/2-hydroxyglutaryl-CoA dehydratase subunit BcrC/BadD/HgdB
MTKVEQEPTIVEQLIRLYDMGIQGTQANPNAPKSDIYYYSFLRDYYQSVLQAKEEGKPLVLYNIYSSPEIFLAMDLIPYLQGHLNLITPAFKDCEEFFELAKGHGIPSEICSYERLRLGMTLANTMPPPDLIVVTNIYCTGNHMMLEHMGGLNNIPVFSYDCPYSFSEEGVKYHVGQIKDLIRSIEESTKHRMNYDKLEEIVSYSKQAMQYWYQISQLKGARPAPGTMMDYFKDVEILVLGIGTEEASKFMEAHSAELAARVDNNQGAAPAEKYRLAWWGGFPFFDMAIFDWLIKEFGAITVQDSFDVATLGTLDLIGDPKDPIEYIARKNMAYPITIMSSKFELVRPRIIRATKERQVNASIIYASFTCKQLTLLTRLLRDCMSEEVKIPTLILDGDYCDKRIVSTNQMKERMKEFFSMLEAQGKN